jgi:hypothetical protein
MNTYHIQHPPLLLLFLLWKRASKLSWCCLMQIMVLPHGHDKSADSFFEGPRDEM